MIKLSITLPNSAQLSIEADDPDMIREVLGFTLPQLGTVANELAAVNGAISGHPTRPTVSEMGAMPPAFQRVTWME